jgi:hypothetical protein
VNLEPRDYDNLCALARERDVPLAGLIRRAGATFLENRPAGGPLDAPKPARNPSLPGLPQ